MINQQSATSKQTPPDCVFRAGNNHDSPVDNLTI